MIELKDPKKILEDINELLPWERRAIANKIVWDYADEETAMAIASRYGYENVDSLNVCEDAVDAVDAFGAEELLREMSKTDIVDYVLYHDIFETYPIYRDRGTLNQLKESLDRAFEMLEDYEKRKESV